MERQNIDEHVRTECPHTVIACKYKGIGCTSQLKRKDMPAHEKSSKRHSHLALDAAVKLQEDKEKVPNVVMESVTFMLPGYCNMKESNESFTSPSFYTHPNGYHMEVTVHPNGRANGKGSHLAISTTVLNGDYDDLLKWPLIGKYTCTVLNQLQDRDHYTVTLSIGSRRNVVAGCCMGRPIFIPHATLAHDPDKSTQYLMDDRLYFRVSVEVPDRKPWLRCTVK
jgi:hypothetical protein